MRDVTVFTKNRNRLLAGDIACGFLSAILVDPKAKPLLSDEHFRVDGMLIEARASIKGWVSIRSFRSRTAPASRLHPGATARWIFAASRAKPTRCMALQAHRHGGARGRHRHGGRCRTTSASP